MCVYVCVCVRRCEESLCGDVLFRVAVSTLYGFGIFDLVRSKTVFLNAVSVPSGKFSM